MVAWHDYSLLSHRFLPILLLWLPGALILLSGFSSLIGTPTDHLLVSILVVLVFVAVLKLWWEIVDWGVRRVRG